MFAAKGELFTRPSGYQISRSVRFRSSATAYFNRTPASATNRTTWTWSGWVKRGDLSRTQGLFGAGVLGNNANFQAYLNSDNTIYFQETVQNVSNQLIWASTSVYRDPSSWYHLIIAMDTTQATAADRAKVYVNGVQVTGSFSVTPSQNQTTSINNSVAQYVGAAPTNTSSLLYMDGYQTEINFVDGQALTPSSFGAYDGITGVWKPKKYTGTYGTNGFYLNFSDNSASTAAAIGKDYSGNGSNWTPNNISVTAGATYDSMLDTPTPFPDGSTGRGNYAVLNPIFTNGFSPLTLTNGNLTATSASGARLALGTIYATTDVYYFEATCTTVAAAGSRVGIRNDSTQRFYDNSGNYFDGATSTAYGATYTTGDVIGVAFNLTNQTITFYKNNTSQGQKTAIGLTGILVAPFVYADTSGVWNLNFGQRPFTYTPPSGFLALNTQNLPIPTIANGASYMAATTYTGTGAALTIANSANNTIGTTFQPDWVWIKDRSAVASSNILDSVRGVRIHLESNTTNTETTEAIGVGLTAFNSNGFSLGTDNAGAGRVNFNGDTFVAWQWNAGGSTVTNASGSISAQVRANTTAGFSIVTYTGTGVSNATVGHGLGVTPSMIILKDRDTNTNNPNWIVWHSSLSANNNLYLNTTDFQSSYTITSYGGIGTSPTSSVFTLGNGTVSNATPNENGDRYVVYCFSAVAGYSAFGSYTGNSSTDGPFIFTGFRPRWIMFKKISGGTDDWEIIDTSRNTSNVNDKGLAPNTSAAEISSRGGDVLSNGFKLRFANGTTNESGFTYLYMAFAENPFKYSLAR